MRAQLACTNATGAGELPQPIESRALQGRACFTARSMQWAVVDHAKHIVQVTSIDELHTLARASAPRSNLSGLLARQPLQLAVHITATHKLALRATKRSNDFFSISWSTACATVRCAVREIAADVAALSPAATGDASHARANLPALRGRLNLRALEISLGLSSHLALQMPRCTAGVIWQQSARACIRVHGTAPVMPSFLRRSASSL